MRTVNSNFHLIKKPEKGKGEKTEVSDEKSFCFVPGSRGGHSYL